jgi:purine-binding chemotaxis protein CheW
MSVTDAKPQSANVASPAAGPKNRLDWADLHRRLDVSQSALRRKLAPGPEERQKILRARARQLATAGPERTNSPQSGLEVVEFILGPERYGIESSHIREIHSLSEFTPLPCTPAFVLGLVNVRGQILSIINIKKLFDLPEKGLTDLNKVIIVQSHAMEVGILADAIVGVRVLAPEALHPALPTMTGIRAEYLKGIAKDSLVVLDIESILADEKILVNELAGPAT